MSEPHGGHIRDHIARLFRQNNAEALSTRLSPKLHAPPPKVPTSFTVTAEIVAARWDALPLPPNSRAALFPPSTAEEAPKYARNIENFVGTVRVPVGLAGPLRVNGLYAQGDYYVPLATTEAALVASYSRGSQLITECGGCTSLLMVEGMNRSPGFQFRNLREAGAFIVWATGSLDEFRKVAEATTRHGKLVDMRTTLEGNHVYLNFEFHTADASGQNMVTIATQAILDLILRESPVAPQHAFIEANMSGDKKASAISFLLLRGRKVTAEVVVPRALVEKRLHTTPETILAHASLAANGGILSGTMGVQGHYANGLAALYIACGQDAACVAESAVGVTRYAMTLEGDLYASVTLPSIMVGTVGGGTGLPSQKACLDLLGLHGPGKSQALAEVAAGLCLAGELSITAGICSGDFAKAHALLARGSAVPPPGG